MWVTFERYVNWHKHVATLAYFEAKKFGIFFRVRKYLFPENLYTICNSERAKSRAYIYLYRYSEGSIKILRWFVPFLQTNCPRSSSSSQRLVPFLPLFPWLWFAQVLFLFPPLATPRRSTRDSSLLHEYTTQLWKPGLLTIVILKFPEW